MAAGVWNIVEIRSGADGGGEGERFVWSASTTAPTPEGGGRAAPRAPWTFGVAMRQKRTDYPGARQPSTQILGGVHKPFTLEGTFDDRYNFPGYAVAEARRFEEMVMRGNPVRVSFQDQTFEGIIDDVDFPYRRAWQIGYSFRLDVHGRPDRDSGPPARELEFSPVVLFNALDLAVQATLDVMERAPRPLLVGATTPEVEGRLASLASAVDQLGATLDNRDLRPPENPVDGFTRMATQFETVRGEAYNVLLQAAIFRSDVQMAVQTAMGVLDFEDWSRSMRYMARVALGGAASGSRACLARSEPDAVRLYRPQQDESLYAISRKFYGTPHAWRLIYDRNQLTSVSLTGDEILIIPERGQA